MLCLVVCCFSVHVYELCIIHVHVCLRSSDQTPCSKEVHIYVLFITLVALPYIPGFELSQLSCPGSSVGRVLA